MADQDDDDDIYNDPQTIGDTEDDVNGQPEDLPNSDDEDPSESIFTPEKETTPLDDRGPIDELELTDAQDGDDLDASIDPALLDDGPSSFDGDSYNPNDEETKDEQDGTEE
jgi:hypothetical protein